MKSIISVTLRKQKFNKSQESTSDSLDTTQYYYAALLQRCVLHEALMQGKNDISVCNIQTDFDLTLYYWKVCQWILLIKRSPKISLPTNHQPEDFRGHPTI